MKKTNIILITGATGNLGGAVARQFSEHGWRVIAPVRKLKDNPKAVALLQLPGLHVTECNVEDEKAVQQFIHTLAHAQDFPDAVFQAAGVFLWDDGYPASQQFASPQAVEDFLIRANCVTKENINQALVAAMPDKAKLMMNVMIGSHASTWAADDPRRNGVFTEEGYVHSMQRVEDHGAQMKKHFGHLQVLHTPLINAPETRRAFSPERAPDITSEMWEEAPTPKEYADMVYSEFASFTKKAA